MVHIAHGWDLIIERGPDWLFVQPQGLPPDAEDTPPLAEQVWSLLEQSFSYRLVLELDQIEFLQSYLIGQLVLLHKRIHTHGGVMRVCGLSAANRNVLRTSRLEERFPSYANRGEAVMGYRPPLPR